jgi:hypothetical protein
MPIPRSADYVVDTLLHNPSIIQEELKNDPEKTLRLLAADATKYLQPPTFVGGSGIYYVVVIALAIVSVAAIGGALYLTASAGTGSSVKIPDTVTALGSAAIGALAGLLAPSPARQ